MENIVEKKKICPYLDIECLPLCPGWIEPVEDCLFRVCLTQVKESFQTAAAFLDKSLGLEAGSGHETLTSLRAALTGGSDNPGRDVGAALSLIIRGVAKKAATLPPGQIKQTVDGLLEGITFDLSVFFGDDE